MAWYNSLKDLTGDVGSIAKKAAPFAGFIPGVGPIAAAGLGAAGGLLSHDGIAGALGDAAGGYLGGAGGALRNAPQGIHGILNLAQGGVASPASGSSGIPTGAPVGSTTTYPSESDTGAPGQSGLDSLLGDAQGWLTGNGGKNLLGAAQGVNAALQQKKSNDLANQALATVEGRYNAQAPLRAQGLAGLLRKDTGNPYYTGAV